MVLISLLIINILLGILFKIYFKLTCGICNSSKHLVGKVVIVTGGNAGIGYETAKDLAARGARVILACRSEARGTAARDKIVAETGNSDVHYRHLDLASLASVRTFSKDIHITEKRLDILINNAGLYHAGNAKTEDGLLLAMQTNHFAPFLLTSLLVPLLKSSAPSRIINVSSMVYRSGKIDFGNLNMEKAIDELFNVRQVYCNTKLCNVLMTVELERQLRGTHITANCLHPGVVETEVFYQNKDKWVTFIRPLIRLFAKTSWEGAQTTIYLAVSPEVSEISGGYFSDCQQRRITEVADADTARQLWEVSEKLVKLK